MKTKRQRHIEKRARRKPARDRRKNRARLAYNAEVRRIRSGEPSKEELAAFAQYLDSADCGHDHGHIPIAVVQSPQQIADQVIMMNRIRDLGINAQAARDLFVAAGQPPREGREPSSG